MHSFTEERGEVGRGSSKYDDFSFPELGLSLIGWALVGQREEGGETVFLLLL